MPSPILRAAPRRPGRPARLSREIVARAAIECGFRDLTLAAVAARLAVRHQSLYRYVADREDLVVAALDLMFAEHRWPEPSAPWRAFVEAEAWARWDLLVGHAGLVDLVRGLRVAPAAAVARFAVVVAALVEAGFDSRLAVLTVDSVYALVLDQVARADGTDRADRPDAPRIDPGQVLPGLPAPVARAVVTGPAGDARTWFGEKLELLLDGVAVRAASASA